MILQCYYQVVLPGSLSLSIHLAPILRPLVVGGVVGPLGKPDSLLIGHLDDPRLEVAWRATIQKPSEDFLFRDEKELYVPCTDWVHQLDLSHFINPSTIDIRKKNYPLLTKLQNWISRAIHSSIIMTDEQQTSVYYWKSMNVCRQDDSFQVLNTISEDEDDEYLTLYAKHHVTDAQTKEVLASSEYYTKYLASGMGHSHHAMGEFFMASAQTWTRSNVGASLVDRLTIPGIEWNWKTQTLRSFLELLCFITVTSASYQAYSNILLALQIGTLLSTCMCLCDDAVLSLLRDMTNHVLFAATLNNSDYDTVEQPLVPFKTIVFGFVGWTLILSILNQHSGPHPDSGVPTSDTLLTCVITMTVGVVCFSAAEVFCLWWPTRRFGLTVQNRWLKMRTNWANWPRRSSLESITWTVCCGVFWVSCYRGELSLVQTLYWCMVVGMGISIIGGLDEDDDPVKAFKWRQSLSDDAPTLEEDAYSYMRCDDYSLVGLVYSCLFT